MGYSRTSYHNRPKAGTFAYFTAATDTTITTGGTFQAMVGTNWANDPLEGFIINPSYYIEYRGDSCVFEIDWNATISTDDNGRTVHVGTSINGEIITTAHPSVTGVYCKTGAETFPLSGTYVITLEAGDTIGIQCTSSTTADVITFHHFTTTIRRFFY